MSFTPHDLADAFATIEARDIRVACVYLTPEQIGCLSDPPWSGVFGDEPQRERVWGAELKIRAGIPAQCVVLVGDTNPVEYLVDHRAKEIRYA